MSNPNPKIPIVDLRAQYAVIRDQVRDAIDAVAESQQFILGPAVNQFETEMAAFLGCRHAVGVASGSDALLLALMALGVGPGDAVITTPFTFFSTVSSITRLGATPLFVDIDSDSYLLPAVRIEEFLRDRGVNKQDQTLDNKTGAHIKAILPVHLFGQICDMGSLVTLAEEFHLQIVEDVAQACGARLVATGKERFAGTIGDLGCFSFFPSKTLGSFGDGGLVSAHSQDLASRLRMLRMHGESAKYHHDITGLNSRLDALQAAVLSVKLKYLEVWCEARIERARTYYQMFMDSDLVGNQVLAIPPLSADKSHVFNNYCIRAERRDELKRFLADAAIQSEIYYPLPLHLQKCFADLSYQEGDFPQAELAAGQVLALPLFPELTTAQQETVVAAIAKFYRR
ncbi:MAG: DegT/DnrJ/EryC1/StrS family aminotransferase [Candidatus Binatia bacterium]